jgi:hypothetical protein
VFLCHKCSQALKLPAPNSLMLRHVLCVLCRIVRQSDVNKMTASNLATCIAPSLLWDNSPVGSLPASKTWAGQSASLQLVNLLIEHAGDIWTDPADCIELLHSSSSLGSQPAVSSLSVLTASSGSMCDDFEDTEDNSPKSK